MTYEAVAVTTEFIRLDALLKLTGAAHTGGHAKILIADEVVKVDGEVCTMRGKKLYPGALVEVEEKRFQVVAG